MSDQPVAHLPRVMPPWSSLRLTQCGLDIASVARMTTADEVRALVAKAGKRRAAYDTCVTCTDTWGRWGGDDTWATQPASVIQRAAERCGHHWRDPRRAEQGDLFTRELHAVAMLVEAHRAEFDALVTGLGETASLDAARTAKRVRDRRRS